MNAARFPLPLLVCLLLAGCSMPWQSTTGDTPPDKSGYEGGVGIAIAVRNNGTDPFDAVVRVLGVGNAEIGRIEQTLAPNDNVEKWWSVERSVYSARLSYTWRAASGATSSGQDEVTVDLHGCPGVARVAWALVQNEQTVGSQRIGSSCEPIE